LLLSVSLSLFEIWFFFWELSVHFLICDKSIGHVDLLLLLHGESLRGIILCFVCFIV
jgi:hypothetical protein